MGPSANDKMPLRKFVAVCLMLATILFWFGVCELAPISVCETEPPIKPLVPTSVYETEPPIKPLDYPDRVRSCRKALGLHPLRWGACNEAHAMRGGNNESEAYSAPPAYPSLQGGHVVVLGDSTTHQLFENLACSLLEVQEVDTINGSNTDYYDHNPMTIHFKDGSSLHWEWAGGGPKPNSEGLSKDLIKEATHIILGIGAWYPENPKQMQADLERMAKTLDLSSFRGSLICKDYPVGHFPWGSGEWHDSKMNYFERLRLSKEKPCIYHKDLSFRSQFRERTLADFCKRNGGQMLGTFQRGRRSWDNHPELNGSFMSDSRDCRHHCNPGAFLDGLASDVFRKLKKD